MTPDYSNLRRLLNCAPAAPERIYDWLHTPMSIARVYGGVRYMGHTYVIAHGEKGAPLVRADVIERVGV